MDEDENEGDDEDVMMKKEESNIQPAVVSEGADRKSTRLNPSHEIPLRMPSPV